MSGQQAKQLGLDLVENNNQTFVATMRGFARMFCREHGSVTTDDLHDKADSHSIEPSHRNAWGTVFRGKGWVELGFEQSRRPEARGRTIRRWTLEELIV